MKQAICIPMRIDTAPFWATIFYGFMKKSLISSDKIKRFINDLCAVNDGGEFGRSICDIYPKQVEIKVDLQCDHATFLNLDITIKEGTLMYNVFNKSDSTLCLRDSIPKAKELLEQKA